MENYIFYHGNFWNRLPLSPAVFCLSEFCFRTKTRSPLPNLTVFPFICADKTQNYLQTDWLKRRDSWYVQTWEGSSEPAARIGPTQPKNVRWSWNVSNMSVHPATVYKISHLQSLRNLTEIWFSQSFVWFSCFYDFCKNENLIWLFINFSQHKPITATESYHKMIIIKAVECKWRLSNLQNWWNHGNWIILNFHGIF